MRAADGPMDPLSAARLPPKGQWAKKAVCRRCYSSGAQDLQPCLGFEVPGLSTENVS